MHLATQGLKIRRDNGVAWQIARSLTVIGRVADACGRTADAERRA